MISYEPFWDTLHNSEETTYSLIKKGIPSSTIQRIRNNKGINFNSLNDLCFIFGCEVNGIIEYRQMDIEPSRYTTDVASSDI